MSQTQLITFGNFGGPAGSPNAQPAIALVFDPTLGFQSGDPTGVPGWTDGTGSTPGEVRLSGSRTTPIAIRPGSHMITLTLSRDYFPSGITTAPLTGGVAGTATPYGLPREGDWASQVRCPAGSSIRCSGAEAYALWYYGAIATH